jgi:hypothetical protein
VTDATMPGSTTVSKMYVALAVEVLDIKYQLGKFISNTLLPHVPIT